MEMNTDIQVPQKYRDAVFAAPSGIHGTGLFTRIAIPQATIFVEYLGAVLSPEDADRMEDQTYLLNVSDRCCIDGNPRVRENPAGYMNHSCAPNVECVVDWERKRAFFAALRDIAPGEELMYDYAFPDYGERTPCSCGSPNCRGHIEFP